jgi:hypothetical protein
MKATHWLVLAALGCGCTSTPDRDPPPSPPRWSASASTSATQPALAGEIPSAIPSASADAQGDLAGKWEGRYDARKGTVSLPPKAKDKGLADDGKTAVGAGSIELTILPNGDIRGKMSGALGAAGISGRVDATMIRTVVQPDDLFAPSAMTGILVGEHKGEVIACELHVAGPDATVIRESTVELKRKK